MAASTLRLHANCKQLSHVLVICFSFSLGRIVTTTINIQNNIIFIPLLSFNPMLLYKMKRKETCWLYQFAGAFKLKLNK